MKIASAIIGLTLMFAISASAQDNENTSIESITAAELRDHIFFLASDYLKGRVAATPEYEIAAQYVSAQFAAAGLETVMETEDGGKTFFQGVPFARTVYSDELRWTISIDGAENQLVHDEDFKIMFGNNLNHEKVEMVWIGYGIEEPEEKWNDFEDLDVSGKIMVCITGAPMKRGKPVLPKKIHEQYTGPQGIQGKIGNLFSKGAAAIILIDLDASVGVGFDQIPSEFAKEKVVYKGGESSAGMGSLPSIYMARKELLDLLMPDNDDVVKNYKPQVLENTYLDGKIEVIKEDITNSSNVIGIVPGTDPVLKNEYIVVGAHLDHVGPRQGQICNGADDNASGSSGVIEIAEAVALNPCKRSVVFVTFTAEEKGLLGSKYFLESDLFPKEQIKFNINLDMIGRTSTKNEDSRAHYVVTNKKYVKEIDSFISDLNDGVTDFPLIIDNDKDSPGGSDHQTFIGEGIPAFFFFSGIHADLHQPTDDADKIDYAKAESISRLGYLIAAKLANMDEVPDFVQE